MEKKKYWTEEKGLILTIIVLSVIIVALYAYVYYIPSTQGEKKYSVEVIEIKGDCEECLDVSAIASEVVKDSVLKSKEVLDYNSEEGKTAIEKYGIRSVPALVVISKNLDKMSLDKQVFEIKEDYAVFDRSVPYIELSSGEIKGLVNMKEISLSGCLECPPMSRIEKQLESFGVKVGNYEIFDSSSAEGAKLINETNTKFLPALLISKNIEEYWWIFGQIKNALEDKGDYYLFKEPLPPYKDISTGKIKGKVDITYVENKSCKDCFDVLTLKEAFQGLGVYIDNERHVDISSVEGKSILDKYNITAVPTVILSDDLMDYADAMKERVSQLGTFEDDDSYIFRKIEALGNVKFQNLS